MSPPRSNDAPRPARPVASTGSEADAAVDFDAANERTNLRTVAAFQVGRDGRNRDSSPFSGPWGPSPAGGFGPGETEARASHAIFVGRGRAPISLWQVMLRVGTSKRDRSANL
ncbi:hypothetical protein THAOC_06197 [Thalassiosira oceanica]|uniref:Uncharacterized protein n=1 Tax=Thalassiosira oceanica TaxID=159749 RepID=K0TLZ3_THAOC|nr:hypothetical protein THAOC_06197 [Thalassiosira oceanica]|eukprot:EJK72282.1 hypothetical protein THAOC_06197 [Thalassiosira oceanica]